MQILDPLFTVPLYYDSPRVFREKLHKKLEKEIKKMHPQNFATEQEETDFLDSRKSEFSSKYPSIHRYNNILGYVEIAIDAGSIIIYFYLNGDKRKLYNKGPKRKMSSNGIYHSLHLLACPLSGTTNEQIRSSVEGALNKLEEQCKKWKVYVDMKREQAMLHYIDFEKIADS